MNLKIQDVVVDNATDEVEQHTIFALTDFQLALVGGGGGDVVFA